VKNWAQRPSLTPEILGSKNLRKKSANLLVEQLGCKKFFSTKTVLKVSPQKSWLKTNWGSFFLFCFQVVALKLVVLEVKRIEKM